MKKNRVIYIICCCLLLCAVQVQAQEQNQEDLRKTPVVRAVQSAAPAVVNITTTKVIAGRSVHPLAEFFFGNRIPTRGRDQVRTSLGSGVIVDGKKGLVITNAHVVSGGDNVRINLLDGREFEADIVGAEPDFDIAVLQVRGATDLPSLRIREAQDLMPGETVIAIGNPFGFAHTVTTGVISATGRSIRSGNTLFTDLVQTDTAINPGNSGGPLLNILGEVVGINTVIDARAEGIGFAIPIQKALRVMDDLIGYGHVAPLWLGLMGQDVDENVAMALALKKPEGLLIAHVYPNTPAAKAGLQSGDVVLRMGTVVIRDKQYYLHFLGNHTPDTPIDIRIWRDNAYKDIRITPAPFTDATVQALFSQRWGFMVKEQGDSLIVTQRKETGPADMLQIGDKIVGVGRVRTRSMEDILQIFRTQRMAQQVLLHVVRGRKEYYAHLKL